MIHIQNAKSTVLAAGVATGLALVVGCGGAATKSVSSGATGHATKGTVAAPKAKPKTLMSFKGDGTKNSPKFRTGPDWTIHYSYDCRSFGFDGNFIVSISDDMGDDVNTSGKKGADSEPIYGESGTHYLSVNSECSWKVSVTG